MDLPAHYNKLYHESKAKSAGGNYEIDELIDSKDDCRLGITLVIRPNESTQANIQHFLNEVKAIDPNQYYYQNSDLHITVMSIISCYVGFELEQINIQDYVKLIEEILLKHRSFKIQFKGLTASPSCILLQGFLTDTLNEIRDDLRIGFKSTDLQQSIDKRYAIQTAHSTIIRFKQALKNKDQLLEIVEKYRDFDFGTFDVQEMELVYNDWYQRKKFVKKLHEFRL